MDARRTSWPLRALAVLGAVLALAGCIPATPTAGRAGTRSTAATAATAAATARPLAHVVIIVLENKPSSRILGSEDAPYLNSLARRWALATRYEAIRHPSLPNYLAMTSGTTGGITSDCDPQDCGRSVRTIAHAIAASGRTWRMYAESMPAPCTMRNVGRYAVRHNPFLYDEAITRDTASCREHDVPFDRLAGDLAADRLPDYSFISPDLCNDMHDCDVRTGDRWLRKVVPEVLGSKPFRTTRSLLVVTFDEGIREDNTIATVLAGSAARAGARSDRPYSHYSLLRTIEDAWGLPHLTKHDGKAEPLSDLLR